ncbi:hypothetical protein EDB19DRAFT_1912520 [Suillus lakei]|nr:hypothetical protein EDB19DRAFT_1912520 [Suillus lakei]
MSIRRKLMSRTTPCDSCAANDTECIGHEDSEACDPCMKCCSFLQGPQPQLHPYVIDDAPDGLAKLALPVKHCAVMAADTKDYADSESDKSDDSNSSDDIVLLDKQLSDLEEPAQKWRKLSVVASVMDLDSSSLRSKKGGHM